MRASTYLFVNQARARAGGQPGARGAHRLPCTYLTIQVVMRAGGQPGARAAHRRPHTYLETRWACVQAASLALAPRTFEALGPSEAPGPGTLLALDAEFVAHSPPDTELRGCAWLSCSD